MVTHIKILAWLNIVFGIFGTLVALTVFGGTMFGAAFAGSFANSAIVGITGTFVSLFWAARGCCTWSPAGGSWRERHGRESSPSCSA